MGEEGVRGVENQALGPGPLERRRRGLVDLTERPEAAESEQILAVPTLVRELPLPVRKVIGDLSNTARALRGLGLRVGVVESAPPT